MLQSRFPLSSAEKRETTLLGNPVDTGKCAGDDFANEALGGLNRARLENVASREVLMVAIENVNNDSPFSGEFPGDRRSVIRADIERRLRKICSNFSDEEFRVLVDQMTERKLKSERGTIN